MVSSQENINQQAGNNNGNSNSAKTSNTKAESQPQGK